MVHIKRQTTNDTMKKQYITPASAAVSLFVEAPLADSFGKYESDSTTTGASDGLTNRRDSEWNSALWDN